VFWAMNGKVIYLSQSTAHFSLTSVGVRINTWRNIDNIMHELKELPCITTYLSCC